MVLEVANIGGRGANFRLYVLELEKFEVGAIVPPPPRSAGPDQHTY